MNNRDEQMLSYLENNRLGINDSFDFKCRGCGKCCRNRDDILLSPKDLFKLVKHLGTTYKDFINTYCEIYVGHSSRMPIIRFQSVGNNNRCPFLDGRKCGVHAAKPTVCAIYPIGRTLSALKPGKPMLPGEPVTVGYIKVPVECDHKHQTHTVRDWLAKWDIPHPDEYFLRWTDMTTRLAEFFHLLEERKATEKTLEMLWNVTFDILYTKYDTFKDFEPQFKQNIDMMGEIIKDMTKRAEMLLPKLEAGESNGG